MRRHLFPVVLSSVVVLVLAVAAPEGAHAQGFISPFIGFDFGGDSGCATASDCEDKNSNIGVAFGTMGRVAGFEAELGYARDFFGEIPGASSNVLTFMSNLMIAPRVGPVRPYVVGGVGLFKTHVEFTSIGLLETNNNSFGWDFGGGLMIFFGDHIGVRGDLRRFSTFQERSILGFDISNERLGFNRAAASLVLAF
jgi:hypothetical protein